MTITDLCSIIIPVYNKAGLTSRCLDALLADPPAAEFELIAVDDGSTDSTSELLAKYGDAVRVVSHAENRGFAPSCNDGAEAARGDYLIFLNNDTIPERGWLDALLAYAERHPRAAVVGSKLLFPNDTIQHAGVVFCQEGNPRHIYVGFPADHPAVNKSRRFQAVTAACALVRRAPFEEAGRFDTAFKNDLEDVDLCLRLGQLGHEVHYCHESVLYHLESASRGWHLPQESSRLYRERWGSQVKQDDVAYYCEDELLKVRYQQMCPLQMTVSPSLAVTNEGEQAGTTEWMLRTRSRQVFDLLKETARLTALIADLELRGEPRVQHPEPESSEGGHAPLSHEELQRELQRIELEIHGLQAALAAAGGNESEESSASQLEDGRFSPGEYFDYRKLLYEIRQEVADSVPRESTVLIVTTGDDELLDLNGRRAWHFPQADDGSYLGWNPPDSGWAIAHLEELRARGAQYLLVPRPAFWWLDHYAEFSNHLEGRYSTLVRDEKCLIFALASLGNPRHE